ncbi:MAG TPA: EamA family transporter [Ilumatobacteraceae bacterium]|nr:EamA family transporter [Ilumatobacteraceae bacterium]
MVLATALALSSAVLHAGWNLFAKRSSDPFLALWSQFLIAGVIGVVVLLVGGGVPTGVWVWAAISATAHIPYVVALGWAYHHGDFSLAYPIARGGGALFAAIGGIAILGDDLRAMSLVAIGVVAFGMWMLAWGAAPGHVLAALTVAVSIGVYTVSDSHAVREHDAPLYVFAGIAAVGVAASVTALAMGRGRDLIAMARPQWGRASLAAVMTISAYGLVLVAVRHAPVGYVAALRESSVLIAVFVGHRLLRESSGHRRLAAAALILAGLVLLVATR